MPFNFHANQVAINYLLKKKGVIKCFLPFVFEVQKVEAVTRSAVQDRKAN